MVVINLSVSRQVLRLALVIHSQEASVVLILG